MALFMTLSGFLFATLCADREIDYRSFILNRVVRIAPLFLFWMVVWYSLGGVDPLKLAAGVLLLLGGSSVPGNGWAVVVEFQFYLAFPLLAAFRRKMGTRYLLGLLLMFVLIRSLIWAATGSVQQVAYFSIIGRADQFLLGMVFAELVRYRPRFFGNFWALFAAVATWILVMRAFDLAGGYFDGPGRENGTSPLWIFWPSVDGAVYGFLIGTYLKAPIKLPPALDKALAWLGTRSFSMYLNHALIIVGAANLAGAIGMNTHGVLGSMVFCTLLVVPATVLVSAVTYYCIEKPFLGLRRPYLKAPHTLSS